MNAKNKFEASKILKNSNVYFIESLGRLKISKQTKLQERNEEKINAKTMLECKRWLIVLPTSFC